MEWTKEQREQAITALDLRQRRDGLPINGWYPIGLLAVDLQLELTAALNENKRLRAASPPEAAGQGDGIAMDALREVRGWLDDDTRELLKDDLLELSDVDFAISKVDAAIAKIDNLPAPPSGEQSAIAENGRSSDFNNEEKLQSGQQGGATCPECAYPWSLHSDSEVERRQCNRGSDFVAPSPQEGRETSVGCDARGHVWSNYNNRHVEICIVCGANAPPDFKTQKGE